VNHPVAPQKPRHLLIGAFWVEGDDPKAINDQFATALRENTQAFESAGAIVTFAEPVIDAEFRAFLRRMDLAEVADAQNSDEVNHVSSPEKPWPRMPEPIREEQVEDRWPVVNLSRLDAGSPFIVFPATTAAPFETRTYYPADHPAVLTPDEAASVAHHLPPDHELWKRLFNYAADEGGHS
jgi:hypothetical protein